MSFHLVHRGALWQEILRLFSVAQWPKLQTILYQNMIYNKLQFCFLVLGAVSSSNNGPEDQEVAEITTTSVDSSINRSSLDSCTLLSDPFMEQSADNISLEKSEQESTLKCRYIITWIYQ